MSGQFGDGGWSAPPGQPPGQPPQPAPPPGQGDYGQYGQPGAYGQPGPYGQQQWPPPAGQPWGGGMYPQQQQGRRAPIWVVVLVGVLGLLVGGVGGGFLGFAAGVASDITEQFGPSTVGPDAASVTGAVSQGTYVAGDFQISNVRITEDFADDFEVNANVTYLGDGSYPGGAIEVTVLRGTQELGSVSGSLPPLQSGESTDVQMIGFDDYDRDFDTITIRVD